MRVGKLTLPQRLRSDDEEDKEDIAKAKDGEVCLPEHDPNSLESVAVSFGKALNFHTSDIMEVVKGSKSKKKEKLRNEKKIIGTIREDYEENDSDDYLNQQTNQMQE